MTPISTTHTAHFSAFFYTTVIGVVGAVFSLVGVALYNRWMKNWKYRTVFMTTNIIYAAVNLVNIICFKRWNVQVGVPDTLFVLGADAFQLVVQQWTWIPGIVILSQLCPDGVEATMYALLAGTSNLGGNIALHLGSYLLAYLDCNPDGSPGETEQFRNLWLGAFISACGPLIPLVAVNFLIPDAHQTDRLLPTDTGVELGVMGEAGAAYGPLRGESMSMDQGIALISQEEDSRVFTIDDSQNHDDELVVINLDDDDDLYMADVDGGI